MPQLDANNLAQYVKNMAKKLMEAEGKITAIEDPTDVKMNKMVDGADKKPAATTKNVGGEVETKSAKVATEDPTNVKMNKQDKEQGSDGKVATAVKVEAGGESGSKQSSNAGMKKSDFTSKKDNPKRETGEPFDEAGEKEMNSMDKEIDEGTKTYVGSNGDMGSSQATNVGMKKPDVHEKAQNEKAPEAIADAIEMPKEGYQFKNKNELMEWTRKEAEKIAKLL